MNHRILGHLSCHILALLALAGAGCMADAVGEAPTLSADGKADLAHLAAPIVIGTAGAQGEVYGNGVKVFSVDLTAEQRVKVRVVRESGNLDPYIELAKDGEAPLPYQRIDHTYEDGDGVRSVEKRYRVEATATHIILVGNYRGGAESDGGKFRVQVCQEGGLCLEELNPSEVSVCLLAASDCALGQLPTSPASPLSPGQARTAFDACLASIYTGTGKACLAACDYSETGGTRQISADGLCSSAAEAVAFASGSGPACGSLMQECLRDCDNDDFADYYTMGQNDLASSSASMCLGNRRGRSCQWFATGHGQCAGAGYESPRAECEARCAATEGAWLGDDLYDTCTNYCEQ